MSGSERWLLCHLQCSSGGFCFYGNFIQYFSVNICPLLHSLQVNITGMVLKTMPCQRVDLKTPHPDPGCLQYTAFHRLYPVLLIILPFLAIAFIPSLLYTCAWIQVHHGSDHSLNYVYCFRTLKLRGIRIAICLIPLLGEALQFPENPVLPISQIQSSTCPLGFAPLYRSPMKARCLTYLTGLQTCAAAPPLCATWRPP